LVLELITEFDIGPVVFHWYSGPLIILDEIARRGHYFSVNSAMISSKKGQHIINRVPKGQLLTETDGPFVTIGRRPALPADVLVIHKWLAVDWKESIRNVGEKLNQNLAEYLGRLAAS